MAKEDAVNWDSGGVMLGWPMKVSLAWGTTFQIWATVSPVVGLARGQVFLMSFIVEI